MKLFYNLGPGNDFHETPSTTVSAMSIFEHLNAENCLSAHLLHCTPGNDFYSLHSHCILNVSFLCIKVNVCQTVKFNVQPFVNSVNKVYRMLVYLSLCSCLT